MHDFKIIVLIKQVPDIEKVRFDVETGRIDRSSAPAETNPFDLKRSAGIGVRLYVPQLGLVGFDFGYGFDKLDGARNIGGWRTHFQFGNFNNMYY